MKPGHGGRGQGESAREEGSTPSATAQLRVVGYVFLLSFFDSRRPGRDGLEGERHTSGVGSRTPANQIVRVMEMEKDSRFRVLKEELLERAHKADACREQYSRAYGAQTLEELMDVVKDNFFWAVNNKVLDGEFIDKWRVEFNDSEIWHNQSVSRGYLIATGNATVRATGNATVRAYDNATVRATGNATVRAYGNATVRATGNATVRAYGKRHGESIRQRHGESNRQRHGESNRQRLCHIMGYIRM